MCIFSSCIGLILQVHIEQGPVLEWLGFPLGVVKGIAGQTRLKVYKILPVFIFYSKRGLLVFCMILPSKMFAILLSGFFACVLLCITIFYKFLSFVTLIFFSVFVKF